MAERLNEVDVAEELARADAWQLAQAQEAWRTLRDGRLDLAPPEGLARIFREAEERAAGRARAAWIQQPTGDNAVGLGHFTEALEAGLNLRAGKRRRQPLLQSS